jgi:ribosomal protein S18 acetylase RimI-like enzyme
MNIAILTEDDLESLAGIYKQFWGEDSSIEKMRTTFRRLKDDPNYLFLAAKSDGHLVASAMGIICEELYGECKPFMVIEDVIVDRSYRRKGLGAELMAELERRAVERGCAYIILVTDQDRADAHRFYQSLGYNGEKYKGFKKRL